MSKEVKNEFEVCTQTYLHDGSRRAIVIEYKITKEEVNRYDIILKD